MSGRATAGGLVLGALVLLLAACDDDDAAMEDAAMDADRHQGAFDCGIIDAPCGELDVGAVDTGPSGDMGCVLPPPPEPDCTPAGSDLGDAAEVPYIVASQAFFGLDPEVVAMAPGCRLTELFFEVVESEADFLALQTCEGDPAASGVDWEAQRLVLMVLNEQPDSRVLWVVEGADAVHIGVEQPAYCGGPAPGPSLVAVLIPAGATPVADRPAGCRTGDPLGCCVCEVICDPDPRRGACNCPP